MSVQMNELEEMQMIELSDDALEAEVTVAKGLFSAGVNSRCN